MLKLPFLTTPPFNPPTLSQLVSELFSSCFSKFANLVHILQVIPAALALTSILIHLQWDSGRNRIYS
jgi:hypothetical protein